MAKAHVLDKVAVDLTHGHTQPAIQRLSSLVAAHPHDLDLRHRLAAIHRMTGNAVEAGRWDYLWPGAEPAETAAFERAFPTAQRRLSKLQWRGSPDLAPTEHARERLAALAEAVTAEQPGAEAPAPRWAMPVGLAVYAMGIAGFLALAVLGAFTVVGWLR
jgi:uncharacterized protein DUF6584